MNPSHKIPNREFQVTFYTADAISTDEVDADGPIGPEEVAAYAVERMMNHGGPWIVDVKLIEADGTEHRFHVELCDGDWICYPPEEGWWGTK